MPQKSDPRRDTTAAVAVDQDLQARVACETAKRRSTVSKTHEAASGKPFFKPHIAPNSVELGLNIGALVKVCSTGRNGE